LTAGVTPLPAQTFEIANLTSSLFAGEPGDIEGSIRNTGPTAVENAVISIDTSNPQLEAIERDSSLGDLSENERAEFSFDIRVAEETTSKPHPLNLSVRYEDPSTDNRATKFFSPTVDVHPERDWLSVVPQTTRFSIDTENILRIRIENVESQRLRDMQARLETSAPFESEAPQAYIAELGPSESVTRTFGLTVSEDAVPTDAAVAVNISATRMDGETIRLDTYQVPITVDAESTTSDTTLFGIGALFVVVLLVGGWWWMNR
jgi:hypothetical protein